MTDINIRCVDGVSIKIPTRVIEKCVFFQSYAQDWKETLHVDYSSYIICAFIDAILTQDETALVDRLYPLADYFGYTNLSTALATERDRQITATIIGFLNRPTTPNYFQSIYMSYPGQCEWDFVKGYYYAELKNGTHCYLPTRAAKPYSVTILGLPWKPAYTKIKQIPYNRQGLMDYFNTPYLIHRPYSIQPGKILELIQMTHTDKEEIHISETGTIQIEFRPKIGNPNEQIRYDVTPEMLKYPKTYAAYN